MKRTGMRMGTEDRKRDRDTKGKLVEVGHWKKGEKERRDVTVVKNQRIEVGREKRSDIEESKKKKKHKRGGKTGKFSG